VFRLRATRMRAHANAKGHRGRRIRDLTPGVEHRDRNVILSTLAFVSRSLTLAISHPHLIAQVMPRRSPRKCGLRLRIHAARRLRCQ
jgi:hypothetical protein